MDAAPPRSEAFIAIVIPNEAILDALLLLMAVSGLEARTYKSGEAFVDDLSENPPDCLILDSHLPGLSGADVARTLLTRYPEIPIIGVSSRPGNKLANEILSAGADVMLTKPVGAERVVSEVQALMA